MDNLFKIVQSSAGSGKTFTLVREYLGIVLRNPADYRHVLAITFTNKATAEMKERIIRALVELSAGGGGGMKAALLENGNIDDLELRARQTLELILHDYSSFSVFTIDSFFQKILRGLAREIGLPLNTHVQLSADEVREEIVGRLFEDVGRDAAVTRWITELVEQKLFRDGRWNIHNDLLEIAGELFKPEAAGRETGKEPIRTLYRELQSITRSFESTLKRIGEAGLRAIGDAGAGVDDFMKKSGGPAGYFLKIAATPLASDKLLPGVTVTLAAQDAANWLAKSSKNRDRLLPLVETTLLPLLREALQAVNADGERYLSALLVQRNIYLPGLLMDLGRKLAHYRREKNLMMLSDTAHILSRFLGNSDTSFVFEKTGSRYKHLLFDEFQDTSGLQWSNLLPLVIHSLGSGHFTLVVGDAKQSIYRWRGGDTRLLAGGIQEDLRRFSTITRESRLETNYRSREDIVEFNNTFFSLVPEVLEAATEVPDAKALRALYAEDVRQDTAGSNRHPGYVRIRFEDESASAEAEENEAQDWKDRVLTNLPGVIEDLRSQGYRYGDIAILVRKNDEGNRLATFLSEKGITQVESSDSLLIHAHPAVVCLINGLRFLDDPSNPIARAQVLYAYTQLRGSAGTLGYHALFSGSGQGGAAKKKNSRRRETPALFYGAAYEENLFNRLLPPGFTEKIPVLARLPVYPCVEELLRVFGLDSPPDAFVDRFLDALLEFSARQSGSIRSFLQWWDTSAQAKNCSVVTSGTGDSIRILTIHKSKGLQFPVVLMPFCNWTLLPSSDSLFWVQTKEAPYADFGALPLHPSKKLENTVFRSSYEQEVALSLQDNVNLLYVAFTRAEERLYAWCAGKPGKAASSAGSLIREVLQHGDLAAHWSADRREFTRGREDAVRRILPAPADHPLIRSRTDYPREAWQKKLTIAARSREYADSGTGETSPVSLGILAHQVLAQAGDAGSLRAVVERYYFEGLMDAATRDRLVHDLEALLQDEQVKPFFDPGSRVLTEREIVLPDESVERPDRIVFMAGGVAVVDFKTGKEHPAHEDQVRRYVRTLQAMGHAAVDGYLVYLTGPRVKKIT
jgi:ATP-dependent helicase/nuclease subunit A